MPDYTLPATDWISWAIDAGLTLQDDRAPDAMLLWLCEPDESFHWHGIGSAQAQTTLAHADAEFGRLLDHLSGPITEDLHIIALSDHGQISLTGERLDLQHCLAQGGFSVSREAMGNNGAVLAVDTAGGIWVRDRDPHVTRKLADWLRAQPWCGPLFSCAGLPGTLPTAALRLDHARAPDLSVVLRSTDQPNTAGIAGSTVHDAPYPIGGGCHGGLNPHELHTFLALGGPRIRQGRIDAPAGNIDILPTVLALLGLPHPQDIDGRCLSEVFIDGPDPGALVWTERTLSSEGAGPQTRLFVTDMGPTRYLNHAEVTD